MSIFTITDIDSVFLAFVYFDALIALSCTNKYYHVKSKKYLDKYKYFFTSSINRPILYANTKEDKILLNAAANGDIDIFKYIYNKHEHKITCHQRILRVLCSWSHINIAKWFLKKASDKICIHADDEIIFRNACWYNRLDVAKFVYNYDNTNIRLHFDEAFRYSCIFYNIEIAKWLVSLMPNVYSIEYDEFDNPIPIINR